MKIFRSPDQIQISLEKQVLTSITEGRNTFMLGFEKNRENNSNWKRRISSVRANCLSPVFGVAVSIVREQIFKIYLDLIDHPTRQILRYN